MIPELFLVYFKSLVCSFKNTLSDGVRNFQRDLPVGFFVSLCFGFGFFNFVELVEEKKIYVAVEDCFPF